MTQPRPLPSGARYGPGDARARVGAASNVAGPNSSTRAGTSTASRARSHHDALHMQPGLTYCWCMCPTCFARTSPTAAGKLTGRCICQSCPCRRVDDAPDDAPAVETARLRALLDRARADAGRAARDVEDG